MAANRRTVSPNPAGGWDVSKPGAERSSSHHDTQTAAQKLVGATWATKAAASSSLKGATAGSVTRIRSGQGTILTHRRAEPGARWIRSRSGGPEFCASALRR
jgi:hypothetical protein